MINMNQYLVFTFLHTEESVINVKYYHYVVFL